MGRRPCNIRLPSQTIAAKLAGRKAISMLHSLCPFAFGRVVDHARASQSGREIGCWRRAAHGRGIRNADKCSPSTPWGFEMDRNAPKQLAHKIIGRHGVHVLLRAHCGPQGFGLSAGRAAIKLRAGATTTTCTTRIAHGGPNQGFGTVWSQVCLLGNTCRGANDVHEGHKHRGSRMRRGKLTASEGRHWKLTSTTNVQLQTEEWRCPRSFSARATPTTELQNLASAPRTNTCWQ